MILSQKLRNAVSARGDFEFDLHNTIINGQKRGCCGFVTNPENGLIVYVNTEIAPSVGNKLLYRYADTTKDYRGYHNRFTRSASVGELAEAVVDLLGKPEWFARDCRI